MMFEHQSRFNSKFKSQEGTQFLNVNKNMIEDDDSIGGKYVSIFLIYFFK